MSRINNKYSKEFKLEVVKKYLNGEEGSKTLAKKMGVRSNSQIKDWVKKYKILGEIAFDFETRGRFTGSRKGRPRTKFETLEEEIKYLRMENEYLKKLRAQQKMKKTNKFQIIDEMKGKYPLSSLCLFAELSRSGYYKWKNNKTNNSSRTIQNIEITSLILKCHQEVKGIYGVERMKLYVNKHTDYPVNHKRIYRIMKENGIKSVIRKKHKTRCYQPARIAENILNRNFNEAKPLKNLTMDTTYIEVLGTRKFIYLNAVKDVSNKEIVAYEISLRNDAELVDNTIDKLFKLPLDRECLIHTDQGATYTRLKYIKRLEENGVTVSMSRRGNCWDNAPIESFFSHFKSESLYLEKVSDIETTIKIVEDYIKFYNNVRIQKKLNGLSPIEYRAKTA
ncbi:MAG: IS3 family transposase [Cetobacterium sp.]